MKRLTLIVLTVLAAASLAAAGTRLSVQMSGGLNFASGGDLARGIRGYEDYLQSEFLASDGLAVPTLGYRFSGEVLYHFSDRIAAGLAVGYLEHLKQGRVTYNYFNIIDVGETIRTKVRSLPVSAVVHYALPLSSDFRLDLSAGFGAYPTELEYSHRQDLSLLGFSGSDIYSFKADRTGWGGHLGVGLEWVVAPRFSLLLTLTGRLASVSGFVGDWSDVGQGDFWDYEAHGSNHRMWSGRWLVDTSTYDFVAFSEKAPEGDEYFDVREARLGLTGFTAALGFKVGLF